MLFRRFLAAFMILVSLTAQARAVIACEAMPGGASPSYCCPLDREAPCQHPEGAKACCDQGSAINAPLAEAAASQDISQYTPFYPVDPPVIAAADFQFAPVGLDSRDRYRFSPELTSRYRLRPLYLQTARLRL